jgi:hypothetical protein
MGKRPERHLYGNDLCQGFLPMALRRLTTLVSGRAPGPDWLSAMPLGPQSVGATTAAGN